MKWTLLLIFLVLTPLPLVHADKSPMVQVHTNFDTLSSDAPDWLIIIHDADSPAVYPYLFQLTKKSDYFFIFTDARHYRVSSVLTFEHYHKKINNFCQFPLNVIDNESLDIWLSGRLTPDLKTVQCRMFRRK